MYFQSLCTAQPIIKNQYSKNPRRSISATFRHLRSQERFSFFGDYPILATIVYTISELGITPTRTQITYALNCCEELRHGAKSEKSALLESLFYPFSVVIKQRKNVTRQIVLSKTTTTPVTNNKRSIYA